MRVYTPIVNGRKATTPGEQGASLNVVGPVSQPATVDRLSEVADISRVLIFQFFTAGSFRYHRWQIRFQRLIDPSL
jgi:hypothetical protein